MASGSLSGSDNSSSVAVKLNWSATRISGNTFSVDLELFGATDGWDSRTCWAYISFGDIYANPNVKVSDSGYQLVYSKYGATVEADDNCQVSVSIGFGYTSSGYGAQESWGSGTATLGTPVRTVYYYDGSTLKGSYEVNKGSSHSIQSFSLSYPGDGTSSSNFTITGHADEAAGVVSNTSVTATKTVVTKHTHTGWSTSSSATSATYGTTGSFTVNSDTYLYAVWRNDSSTSYSNNTIGDLSNLSWSTDVTKYTVTLKGNSTNVSLSPTSLEASITTTHTFKGWGDSSGATTALGASTSYTSAKTVYAIWQSTTDDQSTVTLPTPTKSSDVEGYTVTLNNNDGTGSTSTVAAGMTTSYTFKGWSTSSSASSGTTGSYKATGNVTLYATWQTNDPTYNSAALPTPTRANDVTNHTVTLNGNGGTTTTKSVTTEKVVSYTFKGWATSSSASSGSISAGAYNPTDDITLYATWSANSPTYPSVTLPTSGLSKSSSTTTYTTTLSLNGGSHSKTSVTSGYTTSYEFSHWSSTTSGSSVGTSISGTTYSTLYAIWSSSNSYNTANLGTPTKSASYTVTFNASGGSVSPTSKSISGTYSFLGWYTTNSSSGTKVSNPSSYRATSNNTLYAIWSSSPTMTGISLPTPTRSVSYKVTFDPSGGSVSPTSKNVTGSYSFSGWSTASGDSSKIVSSSNYTTTSSRTLYAIWSSSPSLNGISLPTPTRSAVDGTFTVTLDGNGGTLSSSIANPIVTTAKTSFSFAGWSTASGDSSKIISNTSSYTTTSASTIYAIWTPDTDIDGITLPTSGVTRSNSTVTTYKITLKPIDGTVSKTSISTNKIRRYTFKGWSPSGSTSNMVSSTNYIPSADITLKAAYSTADSVNPVDLPDASKTDHTFLGWSTVEDGTSYVAKRYTTSSNITLYANYLANYRASLWIWYNGKWNKCIVNLFTGDRFTGGV